MRGLDPVRTLLSRTCAGKLGVSQRCSSCVFVTDADWHTTRDGRTFSSTTLPVSFVQTGRIWEDSGVVSGGVNRRGGANGAPGCARFQHRVMRESFVKSEIGGC